MSNRLYEYTNCFERIIDSSVKITRRDNAKETEIVYSTPIGEINTVIRSNDSNPGTYYKKWLLETEDDIKVKTYIDEATDWRFNRETYDTIYEEWGDNGAPTMYICRTPIQEAFVETMGVENTIYALHDSKDIVERYFDAKEESNLKLIREINKSPIRIINYGDNIHCGITSPQLFERYILPVYERRPILKGCNHTFTLGRRRCRNIEIRPFFLDGQEAITPFPARRCKHRTDKRSFKYCFVIVLSQPLRISQSKLRNKSVN